MARLSHLSHLSHWLLSAVCVLCPCTCFYVHQVPLTQRSLHISSLMRQLAEWALSPAPAAAASTTAGGGAADATASHMAAQLQLQDSSQLLPAGTLPAAAALAAVTGGGGWDACKARQQALLQLPLDASEEGVLVAVLRERMAAGRGGGHLLPLYFLQVSPGVAVLGRVFVLRGVCFGRWSVYVLAGFCGDRHVHV